MPSPRPLILVCGVPGAGESSYGQWLQANIGFLHLDVERPGVLDAAGLRNAWDLLFGANGTATVLIEALRSVGRPVVIDWGFPPNDLCFAAVGRLQVTGVVVWWFEAEKAVVARTFESRGSEPLAAFKRQMAAIKREGKRLKAVYGKQRITTVQPNGRRLSNQDIFRKMFGPAPINCQQPARKAKR